MKKLKTNKRYNINKRIKCTTYRTSPTHKVLQFRSNRNTISDKDIMSLLMGVIKLVRESERNKIMNELKDQLK